MNESTSTVNYISRKPDAPLAGEISVPGDNSISHRALIMGAIATGDTEIDGLLASDDTFATMDALRSMGVSIEEVDDHYWIVHGVGLHGLQAPDEPIHCHHSGSTMRLLLGLLSGQAFNSTLTGDWNLLSRSMMSVVQPLMELGANIVTQEDGTAPLHICGGQTLQGGTIKLPFASVGVKSAILLAALYAKGTTTIVEAFTTRNHTETLLKHFGYDIQLLRPTVSLQGGGTLTAQHIDIPGDISAAAYFMIAATITPGSDILLHNVIMNETRIGVINILRIMGASISIEREDHVGNELVADLRVRYAKGLQGVDIPIEQVPLAIDEFPVLFVAAACAKGTTILREAEALRLKSTDRIQNMAAGLRRLGVELETQRDGILIKGGNPITGGQVNCQGDPRVAMALAIAGCVAEESVMIQDCQSVADTLPNFIDLAKAIGMNVDVII